MLATLTTDKQARVERWARHHRQNLTRGWFDGNQCTNLVHHQALGIGLQVGIDRERKVMTSFRHHVILAVLVMPLDAAMGIAQQDLLALVAA